MASRHVPKVLMYRSNYYDTPELFRGNFYSDISNVFQKKIEARKAHRSELERVDYKWVKFIERQIDAINFPINRIDYFIVKSPVEL